MLDPRPGRRDFLRLLAVGTGGLLAACRGGAPSATPSGIATVPDATQPSPPKQWLQVEAADPGPRRDHTLTADLSEGLLYLFGGRRDGVPMNDVWVYDIAGKRWEAITQRGPLPRFGHNASVIDGKLYVFGGQGTSSFFNDLWRYDHEERRWEHMVPGATPPDRRYGAGGTAIEKRIVVTHGFRAGRFDDTWSYHTTQERWRDATPSGDKPVKRCLMHLLYMDGQERAVLFGGQTNEEPYLGDTWLLDPKAEAWERVSGKGPSPRNQYAASTDAGRLLLYGGFGKKGPLEDLWAFDGIAWERLEQVKNSTPEKRGGAAAAFADGDLYLYGGSDGKSDFADFWQLVAP